MNNTETKNATAFKRDVYDIVTEIIIEKLKKGTVPWKQPWSEAGLPQNLMSRRPYRGINVWLLASLFYAKNFFLTFKQLKELGGRVKNDEKAHLVVYWNWIEKEIEGGKENGEQKQVKKVPFLRYYKVYNIEQCEGIPEEKLPPVKQEAYPIPACEKIVENMPLRPSIRHKEARAFYHPLSDFVNMPKMETFVNSESYYATLFHELVHSTGHYSRLNRKELIQMSEFGFDSYSLEELVAEIGACYLESITGIMAPQFEQNASYIDGWLQRLKGDKHFIFIASSYAQKATDFILNLKPEEKEEKEQMNGEE